MKREGEGTPCSSLINKHREVDKANAEKSTTTGPRIAQESQQRSLSKQSAPVAISPPSGAQRHPAPGLETKSLNRIPFPGSD